MEMRIRHIFLTLVLLAVGQIFAQQSLSLEAGGKALFIASLNYEYRFAESPFGLGASLGMGTIGRGTITRQDPNGSPKDGRYTDMVIPCSGYGFGTWGDRHRFYATLGVTLSSQLSLNRYPSGRDNYYEGLPAGFLGAGYEFHPGPWFFRVIPYVIYIGEEASGFFPPALPWVGLSVGRVLD